ncbi:(5-formylfuran-3-yl)methyl phosphate synthase [Methanospirillum stamsii]|uniref:(5-formylfuran-3-yl)methyl phosphate synthase n=1 Tax=Methanospirillum stamsii TaxID=1277351 RepID=A0A2V2N5Q5_9EURY|nr:(5-formylfuran-3-yl)methyl phosphate synthase [Methanospirillum stamsii]PWR75424.1 (5-formylfuran-3-yl)methyl phosphate synthase [Methanospirillum stamsii]
MQLLVSPATIEEAKKTLSADIVDVKRPEEGSLGASFPWIISAIKKLTHKPVSAAIGDFDYKPGGAALTALGAATAGADYVKIGLMFDGIEEAQTVIQSVTRAVKDTYPQKSVVIAAYSDWERLDTISPFDMAPLAAKAGADVSMVDTGIKDGKSTFEFMDEATLVEFTNLNRSLGIKTALAGSLKFQDIDILKRIDPEIIGVRGMVCGGDRRAMVQEELVLKAVSMVH